MLNKLIIIKLNYKLNFEKLSCVLVTDAADSILFLYFVLIEFILFF